MESYLNRTSISLKMNWIMRAMSNLTKMRAKGSSQGETSSQQLHQH